MTLLCSNIFDECGFCFCGKSLDKIDRNESVKPTKESLGLQVPKVVRKQFGEYRCLMPDLLEFNNAKFRNYIRIDQQVFVEQLIKAD